MEEGALPTELTSSLQREKSVRAVGGGEAIAHRYREAKAPVERGGKMNGQRGREECCGEWAYKKRSMRKLKPEGTLRDATGKKLEWSVRKKARFAQIGLTNEKVTLES